MFVLVSICRLHRLDLAHLSIITVGDTPWDLNPPPSFIKSICPGKRVLLYNPLVKGGYVHFSQVKMICC